MPTLELGETALVGCSSQAAHTLTQLRAWGVGAAIDDFGTGSAGLRTLLDLALEEGASHLQGFFIHRPQVWRSRERP